MTDYKNYALEQLENFLHDCINQEATPQEIYDKIKGVVEENYYIYKNLTYHSYELLALLNGNGKNHLQMQKESNITKWVLPVEFDESSDEYFITLPHDILDAVNLNEGDFIDWIPQSDGSFLIKKHD